MRSFGIVPFSRCVDHLLEEHLVRELHHRTERADVDRVAAHEAQHREQAHERRDELARIAMRVDHRARRDTPRTPAASVCRCPGDFSSQRRGCVVRTPVLERLQHPAVQAVHARQSVSMCSSCQPMKLGVS